MKINDKMDMAMLLKVERPDRFHLNYSVIDIQKALLMAYKSEVQQRNGTISNETQVASLLKPIAEWLVNPNGKYGLLLYGGVGTGKTTALYALRRVINAACRAERDDNTLTGYGKEVIEVVKAKEVVDSYTGNPMHFSNMKRTELLAIDELGVENVDIKNYGNENEPIIDLLSYRYDKLKVTALTSNLTMKQIEERYGLRLADRFNEMFYKVAFVGESYRKTT